MIRVPVADDHRLFRQGLSLLLSKATEIQIVGQARNGQEAIELAQPLNPDVILMDLEMPHVNGLRATEELEQYRGKHPRQRAIHTAALHPGDGSLALPWLWLGKVKSSSPG